MEFKTNSFKQTKKIAGALAREILADKAKRKNALVLGLVGDLGSGKTTFTQGFLAGLGIKKKITSPTFVLMKNYKLPSFAKASAGKQTTNSKTLKYKKVYHLDCYRIRKASELSVLEFKEILADPQNIVLIEWPEVIKKILPKNIIWINFEHGDKENVRSINYE